MQRESKLARFGGPASLVSHCNPIATARWPSRANVASLFCSTILLTQPPLADGSSALRTNIAPPLLAAFGLLALEPQASFACSDERRTPRFPSSAQITAATARCPFGPTSRRIAPLGSRPVGLSPLRRYSDLYPC